jgi:hypothetical protein
MHVPAERQTLAGLRLHRGDSVHESQASQSQGNGRAPSGESQAGDFIGNGNAETSSKIVDDTSVVCNPSTVGTGTQLPSASEQGILNPSTSHIPFASNSTSPLSPQPSTSPPPVFSKFTIALNIAFFILVNALALDPIYFVIAKIQNPSQEVSLGSGITLLIKTCQQLLPSPEITSLGVLAEMTAVILAGIWWYRTYMYFLRRPGY